jgi:hypothetical protein
MWLYITVRPFLDQGLSDDSEAEEDWTRKTRQSALLVSHEWSNEAHPGAWITIARFVRHALNYSDNHERYARPHQHRRGCP